MWLTFQCLDHTRPSKLHQWSRIPGTCWCTHHVQTVAADEFLVEAGISGDWPHGRRGCYISKMTWSTTLHNVFDKNTVIKYVYWQNMWQCKSSAQYLLLFQSSSHLSEASCVQRSISSTSCFSEPGVFFLLPLNMFYCWYSKWIIKYTYTLNWGTITHDKLEHLICELKYR